MLRRDDFSPQLLRAALGANALGRAFRDHELFEFGARWQREVPLPLGKTASALPPPAANPKSTGQSVSIAVVGGETQGAFKMISGRVVGRGGKDSRGNPIGLIDPWR